MSQQKQPQRRWFQFTNWTTGDYVGLFGGIIGTTGVVVALLSLSESKESRKIAADAHALSQKTYDRTAGLIGVRLAIEGYRPEFERIDPRLIYRDRDGFGGVRLTSINDMRELNPHLVVKNLSEEPVEGLRVECKLTILEASLRNLPLNVNTRTTHSWLGWARQSGSITNSGGRWARAPSPSSP